MDIFWTYERHDLLVAESWFLSLQYFNRGPDHSAYVPRLLHLQQSSDPAARAAHVLDLSYPEDCLQGAERRPDGRWHTLQQLQLQRGVKQLNISVFR